MLFPLMKFMQLIDFHLQAVVFHLQAAEFLGNRVGNMHLVKLLQPPAVLAHHPRRHANRGGIFRNLA